MFRRIRIRTKLAGALAIPLVALVAVAGFEIRDATAAADDVRAQTDLAAAAVGPGSLVTHLQDERNRAAIDLIGLGDATELAVDSNEEARELVDAATKSFRQDVGSSSGAFAAALEELEGIEDLRKDIDAYDGPMDISNTKFADEVFTRYTTITEAFFDSISSVALNVDDAALRNGVALVDASTRQSEMRARLVREIVLLSLTGKADSVSGQQSVAALYDRSQGFDDDVRASATGVYKGIADATFADARVKSFNSQVETFLRTGEVDITKLLDSVRSAPDRGYTGLRNRAADTLADVSAALHSTADQRRQVFVVLALAFIVLGVLVTWVVSRSITEPLQSLTDQAQDMATVRLPQAVQQVLDTPAGEDVAIPELAPIVVPSQDEVGDVAETLNAVQRSALDLAVEQAVLRRNIADSFVNLGRRNQNLLNRQLEVITELERDEGDPDSLEGLFRVDHLATRMRRNAESLLVLAGVDPPRQWSAPVAASDIVRAALGEVEDYQRVVVRHLDPAAIAGGVAADLAHVLAEMIENALSFSPPQEPVEVRGRCTPEGYTLAVIDSGVGMSEEDIERANKRLSGGESFTVAPSRYLGHYVAGHLATRMGLVVELQGSPAGGITARIDLPGELLADGPVPPAPEVFVDDESIAPPPPPPPPAPGRPATPTSTPAPVVETTDAGLPRRAVPTPPVPVADADPAVVNGLAKRVPGAQRPDTGATDRPPVRAAGTTDGADGGAPSSPDDVYAFLSSFRAGVERGLEHSRGTEGEKGQ